MSRKIWFPLFLLIVMAFSASCSPDPVSPTPAASLANPASVYCEQHGGKLELRQDAAGGVAGVCAFPDGSACDEWAYYRGECQPGGAPTTPEPTVSPTATAEPIATATAELASDGWKIYRNEKLGYIFHYPADAVIDTGGDPMSGVSILGAPAGSNNWPMLGISHPSDREEYRPPEGVDLGKWLIDHSLWTPNYPNPGIADFRVEDVQIAGTSAIHIRHRRSGQSYASERYFFARGGQLYQVNILHIEDKEDWELYNRFLASIQFEP